MKREQLVFVLAIIMIFPLFSGCWSRNEIETIAIVSGIGIDKISADGGEKFLLTANIVRPSLVSGGAQGTGGRAGQPISWSINSIGKTLSDCERNLNLRAARTIFYGHTRYVVLSENSAREEFSDVLDYISRHSDMRLRILLFVTRDSPQDLLKSFPELENTRARQVMGMESIGGPRASKIDIRDMAEITDELITPGIDPVIANVSTMISAPTEAGGQPIKVLRFEGGGVIREKGLVGWLSEVETRGYMLATGRAREGAFPVNLQKQPMPDTTLNLTRMSSKTRVELKENRAVATIEIRAEGDLVEYHGQEEIATDEGILKMEKAFAKEINNEIMAAVKKAQQLDADIFGFGAELHRSNPKAWKHVEKDWYVIFPTIEVKTKVTADIRRTGFIADPYILK